MASYRLNPKRAYRDALAQLPSEAQARVKAAADGLAHDAYPPRSEVLQYSNPRRRLRVREYWIIYREENGVVDLEDIIDSRELYRS